MSEEYQIPSDDSMSDFIPFNSLNKYLMNSDNEPPCSDVQSDE